MYFEVRETQSDWVPSRDWVPVGLGTQSGTGTGASLIYVIIDFSLDQEPSLLI